ncbi:MAG: YkgJ family cysteine cluster protein [Proteobacteria bacterium]|nr:YkgJ family cysteine cluster protein [Pseudomonadota bacterium]
MTLIFPESHRYDCGSCTKCCRTVWNVHVSPKAYDQIVGTPLFERMKAEHGRDPVYMDEVSGEKSALALVNKGGCIFLGPDRLCNVHREIGVGAKPLGCREFPFLPVPTPDGVYVGLSFYCSAVQANHGRPVEAHAAEIEGMLNEYRYERVGFDPIALDRDRHISWNAYKALEAFATARLEGSVGDAAWDVACVVARARRALPAAQTSPAGGEASPFVVDDAHWQALLDQHAPVPKDDVLLHVERMFVEGVVGVLESDSPEACKANTEAIFRRGRLTSATLGGEIDLAHLDDFRTRFDASWSHAEIRRYLNQLVFRKFLALKRPLASNAAAFHLAWPLLGWYRDLSAYHAGRLAPDMNDLRTAFDVVERGFIMHARNMDPFFDQLADALSKLI